MSTFFPLRVDDILEGFVIHVLSKQEVTLVVSPGKMAVNMKVIHFNGGTWKKRVECMQHFLLGKSARGSSTQPHNKTTTFQRLCNAMTR